jgi:hypothetical protein
LDAQHGLRGQRFFDETPTLAPLRADGTPRIRPSVIPARFTLAVTVAGLIACGTTTNSVTSSPAEGGSGTAADGSHTAGAMSHAGSGPELGGAFSGGAGAGAGMAQASGGMAVASGGTSSIAGGAGGDRDEAQAGAPAGSASPGCQLANPSPELALPFFDGTSVVLPSAYDGVTPAPIVFAFHTSGNWVEFPKQIPATHPLRQNYVIVVPTNMESVGGFESEPYTVVDELYAAVSQTICFDVRNVFMLGHSSGARYMTHTTPGGQIRAAAMIGALDNRTPSLARPSLVIHGVNDSYARVFQDLDGSVALSKYITRNGCGSSSVAVSVPSCPNVTPGCVDYLECGQPLRFCRHDDPVSDGYGDGWPCFTNDVVYEFFESQRVP